MGKKYFMFSVFVIISILIFSCAPRTSVTTDTGQQLPAPSQEKKTEEPKQTVQQKSVIAPEVKELFEKSKTRVSNVYYHYRGPETGSNFYEFYIKGSKIKIKPYLETKTLDKPESYDTIFIDKTARTAASYCEAVYCAYKGKKEDLNYGQAYIFTIFDWIEVEQAKKVGEEVIDSRSTWKLETNLGTLWIDTFYGIPLKVESNGKTYRFEQISVNSVQDSDVVPSS